MIENPLTRIQGELLPRIDREEFQRRIAAGRRLVWAGLYERHDFVVALDPAVGLRITVQVGSGVGQSAVRGA